jgi:hypothetical protein
VDEATKQQIAEAAASGAQIVYVIHLFPDQISVSVDEIHVGQMSIGVEPINVQPVEVDGKVEVDVGFGGSPVTIPVALQLVPGTPVHN